MEFTTFTKEDGNTVSVVVEKNYDENLGNSDSKKNLRALVRGTYDIQSLRIMTGNRICANWHVRNGCKPGQKQEEMSDKDALKILNKIKESYSRITDGLADLPKKGKFESDVYISSYSELIMVDNYMELLRQEKKSIAKLKCLLEDFPVYTEYLKDVRGVGPAMAAVIISEMNIYRAKYPSSFWAYAGIDVVINKEGKGEGRSKKESHLVNRVYRNKDKKEAVKKSITYNPFLKSKLVGVLADVFIKQTERVKDGVVTNPASPYRVLYDQYKFRISNDPRCKDLTKGHIEKRCRRYIIKMFLIDLHREWSKIEGIPATIPYHEAKLGMAHGVDNRF
jgi:hypothetical protein